MIIEVFDVRDNTDKSEGIREVLEGYGYSFYLFDGESLTPFSGSALNAYAVHDSASAQVLVEVFASLKTLTVVEALS